MGRWIGTQTSRGLELAWAVVGEDMRGTVEQVGASRTIIATYRVTPSRKGWSLVLEEGHRTYKFVGVLHAKDQLRFERRLSRPGPFVVEIGIDGKSLIVGRLIGPQHGAAVRKRMWFERADGGVVPE